MGILHMITAIVIVICYWFITIVILLLFTAS